MKQNPVTTYSLTILNIVLGLCIIAPLLHTFSVSFMAPDQVFKMQINLLPSSFYTGNYKSVVHSVPIFRFIANSFLVSLAVKIGRAHV
jgi:sn-glycerol 3-phosphate transport system permease protein